MAAYIHWQCYHRPRLAWSEISWSVQEPEKRAEPEAKRMKAKAAEEIDLEANRHQGQLALRKLYHESDRLLIVFYSSPTCGPCRTLKPIMNTMLQEFEDQVRPLLPLSPTVRSLALSGTDMGWQRAVFEPFLVHCLSLSNMYRHSRSWWNTCSMSSV